MQSAAAGAHRPVHRAQLVAGHVGADVGVLDARADVTGQVGAQPVEQLGRWDRRHLRRRQREHDHVGGVDGRRPVSSPPRATASTRDPDAGTGPTVAPSRQRFSPRASPHRRPRAACPSTSGDRRARRRAVAGTVAQILSFTCSPSKHRCACRLARAPGTFGTGRCQLIEQQHTRAAAPRMRSAASAPMTATARATAAHVATARVEVRCAPTELDVCSRRRSMSSAPCAGHRQPPQQLLDHVGALDLSHPHLRPQGDPVRDAGVASALTSSGMT